MVGTLQFDVGGFRKRIQTMTDADLIRFGKAARYMADPKNSTDKKAVESVYEIQWPNAAKNGGGGIRNSRVLLLISALISSHDTFHTESQSLAP